MRINGRSWHWTIGGVFALLFFTLLSFRLGIFRESRVDDRKAPIALAGLPEREDWMTISQEGRKIGYAHRRLAPAGAGYRLTDSVFMRINTMGAVQTLHFRTDGDLDSRMRLRSFNFELNSSLFRFHARGAVKDGLLKLYAGLPGEEEERSIKISEPLHISAGIFETLRLEGLQPGISRTFHVFDPVAMGGSPVTVVLWPGEDTILHRGKKRRARKVSLDFMGARQLAWIGEDGAVLKEKGVLGIELEKVSKKEALEGIDRKGSADLTELASLPANVKIDDPAAVAELRVRLHNLAEGNYFLDGGRQAFRDSILTVRRESMPAGIGRDKAGKDHPSRGPSLLIQSDHPLIALKAKEIVADNDGPGERAGKIVKWVHRNVRKRPVLSVPNALETLVSLAGDCNEHAVLVAALARAAGVPAEVEAGLVYLRGRFYYHAWNALYVGDWVTADAVLGQMPADATHIRFSRGGVERQADLLGLIGRLRLEILDVSLNNGASNGSAPLPGMK